MKKFAELTKKIESLNDGAAMDLFGKEFRSPGHVPICIGAKKLLDERKGHTELVISMMKMAGLSPAASGCEIMGDNGRALSKEKVKKYAKENNLIFLEGSEIVKAWKKWSR
jgi:3,4-dihydroxy 2-butanone 4-phosphate synthase